MQIYSRATSAISYIWQYFDRLLFPWQRHCRQRWNQIANPSKAFHYIVIECNSMLAIKAGEEIIDPQALYQMTENIQGFTNCYIGYQSSLIIIGLQINWKIVKPERHVF